MSPPGRIDDRYPPPHVGLFLLLCVLYICTLLHCFFLPPPASSLSFDSPEQYNLVVEVEIAF